MFFRSAKPHVPAFNERIDNLKNFGFTTKNENGQVRVTRGDLAAIVTDVPKELPHVQKAGLAIGNEIAVLVNAGYQQYWLTPSKKRAAATANQLKALHAFEEDLKEGLGLTSLYNTSLGTISTLHLYDRVEQRDAEHHVQRPWE